MMLSLNFRLWAHVDWDDQIVSLRRRQQELAATVSNDFAAKEKVHSFSFCLCVSQTNVILFVVCSIRF